MNRYKSDDLHIKFNIQKRRKIFYFKTGIMPSFQQASCKTCLKLIEQDWSTRLTKGE